MITQDQVNDRFNATWTEREHRANSIEDSVVAETVYCRRLVLLSPSQSDASVQDASRHNMRDTYDAQQTKLLQT